MDCYRKHLSNLPKAEKCRRQMRSNLTGPEAVLWTLLRGKQMLGFVFRRQFSVGSYVLDFYCPRLRLDVEVDGESHFVMDGPERDRNRTGFLERMGIRVVRIHNTEVMRNRDGVLEFLADAMRKRATELGIAMPVD
jgi:very-short-patch-repair endonuclease